ncbi:uncharacterized protein LOC115835217 [Nomascus leucogenys]|uniref:uncharacterized protein LOC115835217 n=1 Tax=Nomascus leucogenys TaxID=61853 RepID=UPI00122D5750|nr:uncharacterized protein LOC115835217 [Nomascus leucogenys]
MKRSTGQTVLILQSLSHSGPQSGPQGHSPNNQLTPCFSPHPQGLFPILTSNGWPGFLLHGAEPVGRASLPVPCLSLNLCSAPHPCLPAGPLRVLHALPTLVCVPIPLPTPGQSSSLIVKSEFSPDSCQPKGAVVSPVLNLPDLSICTQPRGDLTVPWLVTHLSVMTPSPQLQSRPLPRAPHRPGYTEPPPGIPQVSQSRVTHCSSIHLSSLHLSVHFLQPETPSSSSVFSLMPVSDFPGNPVSCASRTDPESSQATAPSPTLRSRCLSTHPSLPPSRKTASGDLSKVNSSHS